MNSPLIAICLGALLACPLAVQAVPLKGVALGSSKAVVLERFPSLSCEAAQDDYQPCKLVGETYAGQPVDSFEISFVDGKFASYFVRIRGRHVDAIYEALVAQLGAPRHPRFPPHEPQLRQLAYKWESQAHHWLTADEHDVQLYFFGSREVSFDHPEWRTTLSVTTPELTASLKRLREAKARAAADKAKRDM